MNVQRIVTRNFLWSWRDHMISLGGKSNFWQDGFFLRKIKVFPSFSKNLPTLTCAVLNRYITKKQRQIHSRITHWLNLY